MKLTKTFALVTLVAGSLCASLTLRAQESDNQQDKSAGHHNHGGNGEMMAKELGLTDDQKEKVKVIMEDSQKQFRALREDSSIASADKMAKAKEIRDATQAKLKDVLTPEQMDKFQKFMQQHRPMGSHGNNGGGDKSGNDKPASPPQQ